jgi:cold shock CspA family protein
MNRTPSRGRALWDPAPKRRSVIARGRITRLSVGQGHGVIRTTSGREVWFHRSDVREGTSFNSFAVGHSVTFELLEDTLSGARAVGVRRSQPRG